MPIRPEKEFNPTQSATMVPKPEGMNPLKVVERQGSWCG